MPGYKIIIKGVFGLDIDCQRAISMQIFLQAGYRLSGYEIIIKGFFNKFKITKKKKYEVMAPCFNRLKGSGRKLISDISSPNPRKIKTNGDDYTERFPLMSMSMSQVSKLSDRYKKHDNHLYYKYKTKKALDVHRENRVISFAKYHQMYG